MSLMYLISQLISRAGMWRLTENNPFHLEAHYDDIKFGETKNV